MIWHLLEVWLMVVLAFVVGCLAGAHLYGLVAGSRLALAQGAVADAVGDLLDRAKARFGLAPAWRPAHLRQIARTWAAAEPPRADDEVETETQAEEAWVSASPRTAAAIEPTPAPARRSRPLVRRERRTQPTVEAPPSTLAIAPPVVSMRPAGLAAPRGGVPDNLQRIKGIGSRNEELLNGLGIFHFGQIAAWTPGEAQWIGRYLAFPERIARDDWVGQATLLAMGGETGFQKSAERRRERRRRERDFQARMTTAGAAYDADADGEESEGDVAELGAGGSDEASSVTDDSGTGQRRVDGESGDDSPVAAEEETPRTER